MKKIYHDLNDDSNCDNNNVNDYTEYYHYDNRSIAVFIH